MAMTTSRVSGIGTEADTTTRREEKMKRRKYEEVEDGFPDGWEDDLMISSFTTNLDGTITARVDITLKSPNGDAWQAYRTVRLKRD